MNPPENILQFLEEQWQQICSIDEADGGSSHVKSALKRFAEDRVVGVLRHLKEIDEAIGQLLENWDIYRLGTIERAVLRMGVWEISYSDPPVPAPVVINEAIDLANWFASSKTRTIVNGVLDKYSKAHPRDAAAE